jgi:hypothetical protein
MRRTPGYKSIQTKKKTVGHYSTRLVQVSTSGTGFENWRARFACAAPLRETRAQAVGAVEGLCINPGQGIQSALEYMSA